MAVVADETADLEVVVAEDVVVVADTAEEDRGVR